MIAVLVFAVVLANRTALRGTMTPEKQVKLAHTVLVILVLEVGLFLRIIIWMGWELRSLASLLGALAYMWSSRSEAA